MRADWIECKLKDLVQYSKGKKPSILVNEKIDNDYKPYINIKAFEKGIIEEYSNDAKANYCVDGDLLMVWDGARAGLVGKAKNGLIGSTLMKIEPKKDVHKELIFYYLKSLFTTINTNTKGVGIPHVEPNLLWDSHLILFPLPEQRAIVKKLESLFSSLDAGVADLKKAQQQLKIYRQAVLKKAFEGEWKQELLGDISIVKRGKSKHRPRNDERLFGGNYPFIQTGEIRKANGGIVKEYENTYSEFGLAQSKLWPKGTLCLTIAANIGETAFLGFDACFPDSVVGITSDSNVLNLHYLNYYIQLTKQEIDRVASATAQKNINVDFLENLEIPVPNPEEQNNIVKRVESRLSICDSIEQNIKESLEKAEALRQSILKKAFEGNLLTAQELAECKQAADYEPARMLLERIKAEHANTKVGPSQKKITQPLAIANVDKPIVKVSTDIHAGLIAKVIKLHEENPASLGKLSHIKCEKIAHLVEYHLRIPLGRQPVKDAAGPDDYPHLKKVEHRAKMAGYFSIQKKEIGYTYSSTKESGKAIEKLESTISVEKNKQLDHLIASFLNFDLEVAEIIATTYAGWNNLLITGNSDPSDEEIVYESRENWSERKLTIKRDRFFKAIEWMRKNEIVPTGYGAIVPAPKKKK